MERRLAAVLIADVVGYSRLSHIDEEGTRTRFQADLAGIIEPAIATHRGRLVKTMGDAVLVEFRSVVDALRCAVDIQQQKAIGITDLAAAQRLDFRIGINLGDIIVEGEDIQGEGVNIAHRLQALAQPGGIVVSGAAYDHLREKLPFGYASLGAQTVKNIADPVRAYRVLLDPAAAGKTLGPKMAFASRRVGVLAGALLLLLGLGLAAAWWKPWQASAPIAGLPAVDRPSLVVLPFDNLSDDKEQAYLADGFTEDLTTELARVPGLFVVSRNAAFAYKGKEIKPADVASALGVRYLLEGSIRRVGDEMRINAQLIDGSTAGHLWADRFDGQWSEVFSLQDKVVTNIADALKLRLVSEQGKAGLAGGTDNPAAYEAYLKGMEIYQRPNTPEEFARAVRYFREALEHDPDFGAAASSLAWTYWDADEERTKAMGMTTDQAYDNVFKYLEMAARHPTSYYSQLKSSLLVREHRSAEAVDLMFKAAALNPSDPWNYIELANALIFNGRAEEAHDYIDAALRVDPNPGWTDFRLYQSGLADFSQGRFEEAVASLEKIDPNSPDPWPKFYGLQVLVSAYGHLGRMDQVAAHEEALKKVMNNRNDGGFSQLLTQKYFPFKNEADIERLLAGLSKAGVPELPDWVKLDPKDRLTGPEIRSLVLGRELNGRMTSPEDIPFRVTPSADGSIILFEASEERKGTAWVQGDFLCSAFPKAQTTCGAVFRNPGGTRDGNNEFKMVLRLHEYEFSPLNPSPQ